MLRYLGECNAFLKRKAQILRLVNYMGFFDNLALKKYQKEADLVLA